MRFLWPTFFLVCLPLASPDGAHSESEESEATDSEHSLEGESEHTLTGGSKHHELNNSEHWAGHASAEGALHGSAHSEGHGEHHLGPQAKVVSVMLIGSICYGMGLLYLTNAPSAYVRFCTWKMLAATLSIFIAVLWYQAFDEIMEKEIEHRPEDIDDVKKELQLLTFFLLPLLHFFLWYAILQAHCVLSASKSEVIRTAGVSVGAHICAFAFIQPFSSLMDLEPFNQNVGTAFLVVVFGLFTLWILFMISHVARLKLLPSQHLSEEIVIARDNSMIDGENEMTAISIGMLLSQVLRFAIHGKLPPVDPEPVYHKQSEAIALLVCGIALIPVTLSFSRARIIAEQKESRWKRLAEACEQLSVMTMAWVILFWGHWEVYDVQFRDEPLLGRIVLAVCLSVVGVIVIFILQRLMSLGKKDVTESLMMILQGVALMIAFSWELAFDRAADALADDGQFFGRHTFKFIMCICISCLCIPGYILFFLPMSLDVPDEHGNTRRRSSGSNSSEDVHCLKKTDTCASNEQNGAIAVVPPADVFGCSNSISAQPSCIEYQKSKHQSPAWSAAWCNCLKGFV